MMVQGASKHTQIGIVRGFKMGNVPEVSFERGSRVWVWDSTWLRAMVVGLLEADCVSVRLEHGVTVSVAAANLAGRDPASRGNDVPRARQGLHAWCKSEPVVAIRRRVGNYVTNLSRTAIVPAGPARRGVNQQ